MSSDMDGHAQSISLLRHSAWGKFSGTLRTMKPRSIISRGIFVPEDFHVCIHVCAHTHTHPHTLLTKGNKQERKSVTVVLWALTSWGSVLAPQLLAVTSDQLPSLAVPHFLHMQNRDDNNNNS